MQENNQNGIPPSPELPAEKVGDVIHQARLRKQVDIRAISSQLKINAAYLEALENKQYEKLPADTYVFIFLKSLAKYLGLNADSLIAQYRFERSLTTTVPAYNSYGTINLGKQKNWKKLLWTGIPAVVLILGLVVFLYKENFIANPIAPVAPAETTVAAAAAVDTVIPAALVPETAAAAAVIDTLPVAVNKSIPETSHTVAAVPASVPAAPAAPPPAPSVPVPVPAKPAEDLKRLPAGQFLLTISCINESTWVEARYNGKLWQRTLNRGDTKRITTADTVYLVAGITSNLEVRLNNRILDLNAKATHRAKISSSGASKMSKKEWEDLGGAAAN